MSKPSGSPRLAILGAGGIGEIHARIAHQSGGKITAVLGRSQTSASAVSNLLHNRYGFRPQAYSCLDKLIEEQSLDGTVIATPPQCHAEQLIKLAKHNIPVFCEKPLIDAAPSSVKSANMLLDTLRSKDAIPCFLGISNSYLAASLPKQSFKTIKQLKFTFHTRGPYLAEAIAWDLLPHGFSVLHALGITGHVFGARQKISKGSYHTEFQIGDVEVSFDFRQGSEIPKRLAININRDLNFERVQKGQGATYRVFMRDSRGEMIPMEDPFISAMRDFFLILDGKEVTGPCMNPEANMRQIIQFAGASGLLS